MSLWRLLLWGWIVMGMIASVAGCSKGTRSSVPVDAARGQKRKMRGSSKTIAPRVPARRDRPRVPRHERFADAAHAILAIRAAKRPRVWGFGEVHQKTDSARVRSALKRFAAEMLPLLAPDATDLVAETWVTAGRCGRQEKRVVKAVGKTTKRPKSTENEVLTLLRRGKALGLRPHILTLSCPDYAALTGKDGKLDYEVLLSTVTRHLEKKVLGILDSSKKEGLTPRRGGLHRRPRHGAKAVRRGSRARKVRRRGAKEAGGLRTVIVYGGALHNDLFPPKGLSGFTYAPAVKRASGGRYVEVDLYVPEYILHDAELRKKPWFPLIGMATSKQVVLIHRSDDSYILILRRGRKI